tara:strand:- start:5324 stop:6100 length:777 start_codon:yes stop_codon:yes gene_type:complete
MSKERDKKITKKKQSSSYSRTQLINDLIKKHGYEKYLEIGIFNADKNFNHIVASYKVGVDPSSFKGFKSKNSDNRRAKYKMTSDKFFKENTEKFDIIFIDGLHHDDQVYTDINNSLEYLNEFGTIVCHDMNPWCEQVQKVPRDSGPWTGNCWKAWIKLRQERSDLSMLVVDDDAGLGVIQRGSQEILVIPEGVDIEYKELELNRKIWLNLISPKDFKASYSGNEIEMMGGTANLGAFCPCGLVGCVRGRPTSRRDNKK